MNLFNNSIIIKFNLKMRNNNLVGGRKKLSIQYRRVITETSRHSAKTNNLFTCY